MTELELHLLLALHANTAYQTSNHSVTPCSVCMFMKGLKWRGEQNSLGFMCPCICPLKKEV